MRNNRGFGVLSIALIILGMVMILFAIMTYIISWPVLFGSGGSEGLMNISDTSLNVSNYTAYKIVSNTWQLPFALLGLGGAFLIFFGIVGWQEYGEYSTGGYY